MSMSMLQDGILSLRGSRQIVRRRIEKYVNKRPGIVKMPLSLDQLMK